VAKQTSATTLLGGTLEEEAKIIQWSSFANSELLPPIMAWINPVIGKAPSSPEILAAAAKASEPMIGVVERALECGKRFLVGDVLTMADLFVVAALPRGYQFVCHLRSLFDVSLAEALTQHPEQVFAKGY
jgi:elongation factor 1-gamma